MRKSWCSCPCSNKQRNAVFRMKLGWCSGQHRFLTTKKVFCSSGVFLLFHGLKSWVCYINWPWMWTLEQLFSLCSSPTWLRKLIYRLCEILQVTVGYMAMKHWLITVIVLLLLYADPSWASSAEPKQQGFCI